MALSIAWDQVTRADVERALHEYDRLGPQQFFSEHGFAPTTTYELVWEKRSYPPRQASVRRTSSPQAGGSPPVISRAGRAAPSRSLESSASPFKPSRRNPDVQPLQCSDAQVPR